MLARVRALAERPRAPFVAALVGVVLLLPALGAGLFADDITHQVLLSPRFHLPGGPRGAWDLFRFIGPDRADFQRTLETGFWPWWSSPNLRVGFFRPLSALSHALDYRVLGGLPWLLHAESLALFAAIALAAAALYRRLIAPAWVAALAALLFAIDDAHSLTVVWVANRNALFAGAFGFAALVAYDRGRRDGDRASAIAGPVLFALGLCGGEAAVAVLAYLAAHALWLDEAPASRRALALAPYAGVLAAYTALYKGLGYGAIGSGYYLDPATEPATFAIAVVTRLPMLLLAELLTPPSEAWQLAPPERAPALAVVATLVLVATVAVLARTLRGDRVARFCATGMVLSLVPVCATWPNDRLLLFASLGGAGLVALLLARVADRAPEAGRSARVLAWAFVAVHVAFAPLALPVRAFGFAHLFRDYVGRAEQTLGALVPDARGRVVVVVNAPDMLVTSYAGGVRILRGQAQPDAAFVLATAVDGNDGEIERVDDRSLAMTLRRGFADDAFAKVVRGPGTRSAPGDVVHAGALRVEVTDVTDDGRPRRVVFRFDRPLEDARLAWLTWSGRGFVRFQPPAQGARDPVPSIVQLAAMAGD